MVVIQMILQQFGDAENFVSKDGDVYNLYPEAPFAIILDGDDLKDLQEPLKRHDIVVWRSSDFRQRDESELQGDSQLQRDARGWAILTVNSQALTYDAIRLDYDVIDIAAIKDKGNSVEIADKIAEAIKRSEIKHRKGNFLLKLRDNGTFLLEQLS